MAPVAEEQQQQPAPPQDPQLKLRLVEAVIVLEAEPQSVGKLARVTGLPTADVRVALEALIERFDGADHGVQLLEVAGGYTLVPKAELWPWLRKVYGKLAEARLSRAAMETLSIIAYSQPITRSEIETIRGVSPDAMIRTLLERQLIREVGRKDAPGRPAQYGTTGEFLRLFGLASIADLPRLGDADRAKFVAADDE